MQVTFNYLNHKGVTRFRTVEFMGIMFVRNPGFGYQAGWFLHGRDVEKDEIRSFALTHIIVPPDVPHFVLEPR